MMSSQHGRLTDLLVGGLGDSAGGEAKGVTDIVRITVEGVKKTVKRGIERVGGIASGGIGGGIDSRQKAQSPLPVGTYYNPLSGVGIAALKNK